MPFSSPPLPTDDWESIFGDPTKFGLGLFSVCFDILFMFQHYVVFRHPPSQKAGYKKIGDGGDLDSDLEGVPNGETKPLMDGKGESFDVVASLKRIRDILLVRQ